MNQPINLKRLASFLEEANKNTYAANGKKIASARLQSENFEYKKGGLTYHDTYFGARDYMGEEIVYKDDKPMWGMNYYGFILNDDFTNNQVYDFLKKALMQDYDDIIPVRGGSSFIEESYKYANEVDGDLSRFSGKEEIFYNDELIYRGFYHGGYIR